MEGGDVRILHPSSYYDAPPCQRGQLKHVHTASICTVAILSIVAWLALPLLPSRLHVASLPSMPRTLRPLMPVSQADPLPPQRLATSLSLPTGGAAPAPQPLAPPPLHALSDAAAPEDDDARAAEALAALAAFFAPLLWAWRALGRLADGFEDTYARTTPVENAPLWRVLWDFSRPHTLIGSALCIPAVVSFAAPSLEAALSPLAVGAWFAAFLPSLLINIYITGLNQITDVEIDRVNKPYLPIPSGALSRQSAIAVVSVCLAAGLALVPLVYAQVAALQPFATPALQATLVGSALLGTVYSLPPFRLKRFPLLAATCILAVRGLLINVGFYAHGLAAAFGGYAGPLWRLPVADPRCAAAALFFVVFGVIIALMKDVPDLTGDRTAGIRTFTVRLGPRRMFVFTSTLLALLFSGVGGAVLGTAGLALADGLRPLGFLRAAIAVGMVAVGSHVSTKADQVDAEDPKAVYRFYMYLWRLFYLSYLTLPFIR